VFSAGIRSKFSKQRRKRTAILRRVEGRCLYRSEVRRKKPIRGIRRPSGFDTIVSSALQWGVPNKGRWEMKRILVALALMGAVLVLATGVAWAATVDCKVGVFCEGTDERDELIGTNQGDVMSGLQDDDLLVGFRGADEMEGDNSQPGGDDTSTDGDDELIGFRGPDTLLGFGGSDYLRGGRGDDFIDATEESDNPGKDTVRGSRDQDLIDAVDGFKDTIFCGLGEDEVFFDEGLDFVADNCEIQNPRS
jgi:Ca2+-binding RTX toxin-like protein